MRNVFPELISPCRQDLHVQIEVFCCCLASIQQAWVFFKMVRNKDFVELYVAEKP